MSNIEEKGPVEKEKKLSLKERVKELEADVEGVRNVAREKRGMVGAEDMTATFLAKFLADDHDSDMKEMRLKIRYFFGLTDVQEDNLSNSASIAVEHVVSRFRSIEKDLRIYRDAMLDVIDEHKHSEEGCSRNTLILFHMALRGILARKGMDKVDYDKDD